jgi:hypothetical protein
MSGMWCKQQLVHLLIAFAEMMFGGLVGAAVYWGCMAMELMGSLDKMDKAGIIAWVLQCQHKNGTSFFVCSVLPCVCCELI